MVLNYPNEWGGEDYLFILEKDDFITQQDKDKLFIYNGNYNISYSNCTFNDQEFRVISSLKNKIAYLFGTYGNDEEVAKVVENEIYNVDGPNNKRAFTNVKLAYDNIKTDFYQRLNNK